MPAFRLRFEDGGELILTEGGPKKRAGVWLETPEQTEAELAHIGPEALGLGADRAPRDPRRRQPQAALAPPRPAGARRDRPRACERDPQPRAALAVRTLEQAQRRGDRAPRERHRRGPDACARAARGRQGRQGRLSRPSAPRRTVSALRRAATAGRLRGAHGLLLRELPDRWPGAQGPADVPPAQVAVR